MSPLVEALDAVADVDPPSGLPAAGRWQSRFAAFAGHFALETPAPLPDWAQRGSTLRQDMKGDLAHALEWSVELFGLPHLS